MPRSTVTAILLVFTLLVITGIVLYSLQIPKPWPMDSRDDVFACGGCEPPCPSESP